MIQHAAHQRIHEQLRAYWEALRKGRRFPAESEIDPAAVGELWERCFLVNVQHDDPAEGFRYSYLGNALIEVYGWDFTNRTIRECLVDPHAELLTRYFRQVAAKGLPAEHEGEFANANGMTVKYRCCMLPLAGTSEDKVGFILGSMHWKHY